MSAINFNGLDTAVHGPLRLGVLTTLQTQGPKDFSTLRELLGASDGSLGMHLQKLEETGYIKCQKNFVKRKPKSTYSITGSGRRALLTYIDNLQAIVDMVRNKT